MATKIRLSEGDPNSFSRPQDVVVTHIDLNLSVSFDKEILSGVVSLTVEKKNAKADKLILDTRDLTIHSITDENGASLVYEEGKPVLTFGSKLEIAIPENEQRLVVKIAYETSPKSSALQWLKCEQTAGKQFPYLFSQCQAIHARSMLPCQDTPSVKMPYTAKISAPSALMALMSAVKKDIEPHPSDPSMRVHSFDQKTPLPSYLIALAVGALESRDIGPRSKVWSEKEMVEAAAYEFAETELMLTKAEELLGPYVWQVYDLLVLPPSFPYGGMENPCLTFVTPTLLAGDRSLVLVVAHEIAHSWTGNLVTNKNWEHFWLNEGHTVFVERKIAGRLHDESYRHFEAIGGWKSLSYQIEVLGSSHPYTHLVPDLSGVDPDDAFSSVPYEKGSSLLMHLEQVLGGPEVFEKFIRSYIDHFKYESITTDQWKDYLYAFFKDKKDVLDSVDWEAWFHGSGMPPIKPTYDQTLAQSCATLAAKWVDCTEDPDLHTFHEDDLDSMSSSQIKEFLAMLLDEAPLPEKKIIKMDEVYKLSQLKNAEIRFRWLRLGIRAQLQSSVAQALSFVNQLGRMKFVRPIYRDLYSWEASRQQAIENYKQQNQYMHSTTATMVSKDLQLTQ